jgi:hypothetical protein
MMEEEMQDDVSASTIDVSAATIDANSSCRNGCLTETEDRDGRVGGTGSL